MSSLDTGASDGSVESAVETLVTSDASVGTGATGEVFHDVQIDLAKQLMAKLPGNENKPEFQDLPKDRRDPATGKFKLADDKPAEAATGATGDKPVAEDAEKTPVAPPAYLSADIKAIWGKLPTEAQVAVAARSLEDRQHISRQGNTLQAFEPLQKVIEQHRSYFEQNKANPAEVYSNLMAWNRAVEADPVNQFPALMKAYGVKASEAQVIIAALAKNYGLSTQSTSDDFGLPPDPATGALQARFDAMERQNQQLANRLGQYEGSVRELTQAQQTELDSRATQARATEVNRIGSSIETFKSTVDPEEFEFLRARLSAEIQNLDPSIPEKDVIPTAYANVRKALDSVVSRRTQSSSDKSKQPNATSQARRIAGSNVRGQPPSSAPATSVADAQNATLRKFGMIN